jgi:protein required for attachment to host cells
MAAKEDTWILVANSTFARILKVEKRGSVKELEVIEHREGRKHERDLAGDKPGRAFESVGYGRSALEVKTSMKKQEFSAFAKLLSERLESARQKGQFVRLFLAANPTFLGLLRNTLTPATVELIAGEVDKDITHVDEEEIISHFPYIS